MEYPGSPQHSEERRAKRTKPILSLKPEDIYFENKNESMDESMNNSAFVGDELKFEENNFKEPSVHRAEVQIKEQIVQEEVIEEIKFEEEKKSIEEESEEEKEEEESESQSVGRTEHNYYSLEEDYFLLCKDLGYRLQKPRLQSKEEFLRTLAPLFGRSIKSITKRIDRLRALSLFQKRMFFHFVKRFPNVGDRRKIIFDTKGEKVMINVLGNRRIPEEEQLFLQEYEVKIKKGILNNEEVASQRSEKSNGEQVKEDSFPLRKHRINKKGSQTTNAWNFDFTKGKILKECINKAYQQLPDENTDQLLIEKVKKFKSNSAETVASVRNSDILEAFLSLFCVNFQMNLDQMMELIDESKELNLEELKARLQTNFLKTSNPNIENEILKGSK